MIRSDNDGSLTMKENSFSVDEMIKLSTYNGDIKIKGTTLENLGTTIFSQLGNITVEKSRIETSGILADGVVKISNILGKIEVKGSLLEASGESADVRVFSRTSGEIVVKESVLTAGEEIRIGSHSGGVKVKGNLASMGYTYGLIAFKLIIVSYDTVAVKDNYAYIGSVVKIIGDPCVVKNSINYVTGDPLVCDAP